MLGLEILLLVLYGLCLLFMLGFSLVQLQLARRARAAAAHPAPTPAPPAVWPRVTVQLPLYNELYVAERLLDACAAFDYPPDRLHVQVLDDSTDETVARVAARVAHYRAQGLRIDHVRRPSRQGYKAGALRHGLALTDGELLAIFDADFVPPPDFLRRTVPYFAHEARTGVVQTRWGHLNAEYSLLTELQAFGLNAHFLVEQVGRQAGGHFLNFNGTGGVWRRTCIEDAGNWQADTLTEDLDLSYRAQLRGWQVRYLPQVAAPAELPATLDALKSQQFRWTKGAAETARKHLGAVLRAPLPLSTKLHATFHLLNSSVFVAILLMGMLSVPLVAVRALVPELRPVFHLASGFLLALVPLVFYFRTAWTLGRPYQPPGRSRGGFVGQLLLFLAFSMGLSLHNSRAVLLGLLGRRTAFIRTPKLGLVQRQGTWRGRRYRTGRLFDGLTLLEGLLALYFAAGLAAGLYLRTWGLLPTHLLLTVGYGLVFYYSIRHNFER
ncbi:cellulose synthase family protein [Hymenobacter weizhouensis]|uniref:cellulose synthase family protein n=1 Tax=Hymenobacter sp. YIM 151500-1 TaxID=2987689 RepID=UPI002227F12D|nr:cellulose synthase family protein [Hymenobacter sp. YIM 151500-1]UYZ64388.1 glycosyltransferase family 2 protein [Hymenobacter sp. YIM 151500-1]